MKFLFPIVLACLLVACGGNDTPTEPAAAAIAATETAEPPAATSTAEPNADESTKAEPDGPAREENSTQQLVLTIDPARSEARFIVDEVLLGQDNTVIGVTSQVSGTISVDPDTPSSAQINAITIDARDIKTDSSQRNRTIQRQILRSALEENRYITFAPTAIDGLPDAVTIGEPFTFSITGDLTVRGVTRAETFDATVTALGPDEIAGLASTVIRYDDYAISIPRVPAVASVDEEVRLELEFVATPKE